MSRWREQVEGDAWCFDAGVAAGGHPCFCLVNWRTRVRLETMNRSLKKSSLIRGVALAPLTLCMLFTANHSSRLKAQELLPPSALSPDAALDDVPGEAPLPDEELGEAMLRGPVHEAFAEQVSPNPQPGLIVDQTPPEPIEELPPEVRPEGERVEWIPGYWAWDDDRQDFIWISGLWRKMPPKLRWLPGYWAEVEQGFQWVAGTWIQEQEPELEYIAQSPPETLELGPVGEAPSANHFWVPGHWSWQDTRYAWSPGFWSVSQVNWVWVPTRYLYTPRGYVYCHGYWDYPLTSRGSLFAPYWFSHRSVLRPGYFFRPRVLISLNILPWHFWVRPGYSHYYFGDYYATSYRQRGIYPWHSYYRQSHGIDPLFSYFDRTHRGDVSFYQQINQQFNLSVNESDRRPPRSFRDQRDRDLVFDTDRGPASSRPTFDRERRDRDDNDFLALGRPVEALTESPSAEISQVTRNELERLRERTVALREVERSRRQAETKRNEDQRDRSASQIQRPDRWRLPTMNAGRGRDRATDAAAVANDRRPDSSRPSQLDSVGTIAEGQQRSKERSDRSGRPDLRPGSGIGLPYQASRPATDSAVDDRETRPGGRQSNQPADPRLVRPARPENANRLDGSNRDRPNVGLPEMNRPESNRSDRDRPGSLRIDRRMPGGDSIGNDAGDAAGRGPEPPQIPGNRGRDNRDAEDRNVRPPAVSLPSPLREPERRIDRQSTPSPTAVPGSRPTRPQPSSSFNSSRPSGAGSAPTPGISRERGRPPVAPNLSRPTSPPASRQQRPEQRPPTIRQSSPAPQSSVRPQLPAIRQQPSPRPSAVRPQPQAMPRPAARQPEVRQPPVVRQAPAIRQPSERQSPRAIERPRGGGGGG
ncbi:MAG: hypothetical protein ACO1RT_01125, partial [Planctomycetaceae bacterium]